MCSYDNWLSDCSEVSYKEYCSSCEEIQDKSIKAQEWLAGIVKQLYTKDDLNLFQLEEDLDELCYYLNVPLVKGDLQIGRKIR